MKLQRAGHVERLKPQMGEKKTKEWTSKGWRPQRKKTEIALDNYIKRTTTYDMDKRIDMDDRICGGYLPPMAQTKADDDD